MRARALVAVGSALAVAALAPPAAAAPGAGTRVDGAVVSRLVDDTRALSVSATEGGGTMSFVHVGPQGVSRLVASVDCLILTPDAVQLSGRVERGATATGRELTGLDVFFSLAPGGAPETFSLPRFDEAGASPGCSGGREVAVPVTSGHLSIRDR